MEHRESLSLTFTHWSLLCPLPLRSAFDLNWPLQREALLTVEVAGWPEGKLFSRRVSTVHRAILKPVDGITCHSCNRGVRICEQVWPAHFKCIFRKRRFAVSGGGATLPLQVGFSLSQIPEEVHCSFSAPISSNPSSHSNAQVVFHRNLPGFGKQCMLPLAGLVRASHSANVEMTPWNLQKNMFLLPVAANCTYKIERKLPSKGSSEYLCPFWGCM